MKMKIERQREVLSMKMKIEKERERERDEILQFNIYQAVTYLGTRRRLYMFY